MTDMTDLAALTTDALVRELVRRAKAAGVPIEEDDELAGEAWCAWCDGYHPPRGGRWPAHTEDCPWPALEELTRREGPGLRLRPLPPAGRAEREARRPAPPLPPPHTTDGCCEHPERDHSDGDGRNFIGSDGAGDAPCVVADCPCKRKIEEDMPTGGEVLHACGALVDPRFNRRCRACGAEVEEPAGGRWR